MPHVTRHIARIIAVAGLLLFAGAAMVAQTLPGTRIDNVASMRFMLANGAPDSLRTSTISSVVEAASYRLRVDKHAGRDSVEPGEIFSYLIRVTNEGTAALTDVEIVDTLSSTFEVLSSTPGTVSGGVMRLVLASLSVGASDSVLVVVRVHPDASVDQSVTNTVYASSAETGAASNQAHAIVHVRAGSGGSGSAPSLAVDKSVSRDTVETGGLVTYTVRFRNTGDLPLSNVVVVDTLPPAVDPVTLSGNGAIAGRILRAIIGGTNALAIGSEDSLSVIVRLRPGVADGSRVVNVALGWSDQTAVVADTASFVVRSLASPEACRVSISAAPRLVIGNGTATTVLRVSVTDTLGLPKPDGTPVVFRTSIGSFSNGLDSIVVPVVGGIAVDSLRALIVSNTIVTAHATMTIGEAGVCRDSASVDIVFYPGAVSGIVIDNDTDEPESGAIVRVYASDGTLIGATTTGPDGSYLIPVPQTDVYEIRIQTVDDFGFPMNTVTTAEVSVPAVGGVPPVRTDIVLSGKVYYLVSKLPVAAAGIKVVLTQLGSGSGEASDDSFRAGRTMVDSTLTDTTGSYTFSGLPAGNRYAVSIDDAFLRGSVDVTPLEPGTYVTDVNIPITLNPMLELSKSGPTRAYRRDTVAYRIDVRNRGTLSITSAVVTDSLDRSMRFVSASPAPSFVDTSIGVIRWSVGRLDSAASPGSARSFDVRIRFLDTTSTDRLLTNAAIFTSGQTTDTSVVVSTELFETDLVVTKSTARPIVEIGDQASYTVSVQNGTPAMSVVGVVLEDRPPLGFVYVAGSSHRDTVRLADPVIVRAGSRVVLRWTLADTLAPGEARSVSYRMIVGAGAAEGDGVNRAMAFASAPNGVPLRSSVAEARVDIQLGVFTDRGLVVGKVFHDPNGNAYQDPGERGVKGIELMTEDGTRIVTGDDGTYSIPDIAPGEHVIRVRTFSLPAGATLHAGFNDFAGDPVSRFVTVPAGGIARADFYLDGPPTEDTLVLSQHYLQIGGLTLRRTVSPKNVVFIDDERPARMKLTGLNFEVGRAILRPEAYPVIAQLATILRELPEERVTIIGHTDASPIRTAEFPNNVVLSLARAEAVKAALVDLEGIDLRRIATQGLGESVPVADNGTREGRALNRRVEFAFGPADEQPRPRDSVSIMVSMPIEYDGTTPLERIEWTDSLDAGLRFVAGSGVFGGRPIEPALVDGRLVWSIDGLSAPFRSELVYQVVANRPAERVVLLRSSSSRLRITTSDSTTALPDVLTTVNQTAVAMPGRAFNFVMPSVLFETGRSELRTGAESALEAAASLLQDDPTLTLIVEGHTDSRPIRSKEFASNVELSHARAGAIVDMLSARFGIARARMAAVGFGEHRPVASNRTDDGRRQNRRVEMRMFRHEFWTSVLKEGGVDSSRPVLMSVAPGIPSKPSPSVDLRPGHRYVGVLSAEWAGSGPRPAAIALLDTLPSWMRIDHATVRTLGFDTLSVRSPILGRGDTRSPQYRIRFEFDVDASMPTSSVMRRFSVERRSRSGGSDIQRSAPVLVRPVR